jgi:DNA polymerase III gamma/tau subunit
LKKLAVHINANVEPDVCRQVSAISGGNMRIALNFFQSLLVQSDGKLTADAARQMLGLVGRDDLYKIAGHIAGNSAGAALDAVETVVSTGINVQMLVSGLSEVFRNAMLMAAEAKTGYTMADSEKDLVSNIASSCGLKRLLCFSARFTECEYSMTVNHNKKWVLETLVASLCSKA